MRQGIAIFFAFLMMSVSCKDLIQYAAFKLNQEYISSVFCINKSKPEMKCDGKCYLKKLLEPAKEEKQSKTMPPPDEKSLVVFYESNTSSLLSGLALKAKNTFSYLASLSFLSEKDILHPPEVLV